MTFLGRGSQRLLGLIFRVEARGAILSISFWGKNVLQFWLCYIGKMVQFHVLDLIFSLTGHFTTPVMVYSKVIDVPGYRDELNLIMGRY